MDLTPDFFSSLKNPGGNIDQIIQNLSAATAALRNQIVQSKAQVYLLEKSERGELDSKLSADDLQIEKDKWDDIIKEKQALLKRLTDGKDFLVRNRLRLKAEKNFAEWEAFVSDLPGQVSQSSLAATHQEMLRQLDYSNAQAEAALEMALEKADSELQWPRETAGATEGAGSPGQVESQPSSAQDRAKEAVRQMKIQMGLDPDSKS